MTDTAAAETKDCPYCAEVIKAAAIVCKHCGRDISPAAPPGVSGVDQALMAELGITYAEERYWWRGNAFRQLEAAAAFARKHEAVVLPVSTAPAAAPTVTPAASHPVRTVLLSVGALLGVFLLWAAVRTPSPEEVTKNNARRAIEMCWSEQGRKSLDPGAARFAAGACEMMEARFRSTYGTNP